MANGVVSILSSSLKICNRLLPHLRAQLHLPRLVSQNAKVKSKKTPLVDHLSKIIRAHGPITVAQYMRECLTNPEHGYYMHNDVFGTKGDFITSPEISQVFGELLGVWVACEYQAAAQQTAGRTEDHLQIIELGPGRGTLAADILRALNQFEFMRGKISYNLIEVSPKMKELQAKNLCTEPLTKGRTTLKSRYGHFDVNWYNRIYDVPQVGNCCFIAHEFFDALPIHKFQRSKNDKFLEVMIDIAEDNDPHHFREVLAPSPNSNSVNLVKPGEIRDHVEVSPLSGFICQEMADRIVKQGGFCIIADYGHTGDKEDTFRAFKAHKLCSPLDRPGECDLTADVDFSFLQHCISPYKVKVTGPIFQQTFLHNMGISQRLQSLLSSASTSESTRKDLLSAYQMLCSPDEMGERFKFLSFHSYGHLPAGFIQPKE